MSNIGIGALSVLILLALAFLGPRNVPSVIPRRQARPRRGEFVRPANEAPRLDRLDGLLLITGLALAFAAAASLSRP